MRLFRPIHYAWLLLFLFSTSLAAAIPPEVAAALNEADSNRAQLKETETHTFPYAERLP